MSKTSVLNRSVPSRSSVRQPNHLPKRKAGNEREPVAIVGMGCRFPGGANSPAAFWRMLCDGTDAIAEMPPGRFDLDTYYDPTPRAPGKIVTRRGGFLDPIDRFDASFFGISPREANLMDPQQRLLLEVAWEALEDGGQVPERLAGSRTGVFIGMWTNDYEDVMYQGSDNIDLYVTTGGGRYAAAGRLSYFFDFRGPSITLDTACSSSLVAVHLACQSLWGGESELAIAGGVNLIIEPQISIGYSRAGMLAQDAHCKFGDVRADGYVRSEGVGMIVLKSLRQALADQDPIHALIRGGAVNNDGRSSGRLVAPGIDTQTAMLRAAYHHAGVSPGAVAYVEAHGTGTKAGDPVELQSLGQVLAEDRPPEQPCMIGSVKTNIGHTEAAAGMAGLIKAALCIKHRMIPASLNLQEPNPNIPWAELPLVMQQKLSPWPDRVGPALAGVNGFGITGTNAHIILQEAPPTEARARLSEPDRDRSMREYLLPLSAHTPAALQEMALAYRTFLAQPEARDLSLHDLAYTLAQRRTHHAQRLALVARDLPDFSAQLTAFLEAGANSPTRLAQLDPESTARIVFVFPGQGSQWVGMGRQLMAQEPRFRQLLEQCDSAIQAFAGWSLLEQLALDENSPRWRLHEIEVIQPALFAIEIALAALWRSWGIEPDAVIGHSMGEIAASYVAGALTLDDAVRIVCRRSQLMARTSGQGAMAVVELSVEEAEIALASYGERVVVAVSNSPRATVLAGEADALHELIAKLQAQEIFCRFVKVDVASHSPQMEPLLEELKAALQPLRPQAGTIPIYSTVWGQVIDGAACDGDYWAQNLRQTVRFAEMVQQLLAGGHNIFIEMSPHPLLLPAVEQGMTFQGAEGLVLPSLRRNEEERAGLLHSLGALYRSGCALAWDQLLPGDGICVSLPSYPWQRERFWYEAPANTQARIRGHNGSHALLGAHVVAANGAHLWELALNTALFPYLADHQVRHKPVLPATAYLEMALAGAAAAFGAGNHLLVDVEFKAALFLSQSETVEAQLIITPLGYSTAKFQFFSRLIGTEDGTNDGDNGSGWQLHVEGSILLNQEAATPLLPVPSIELSQIMRRPPALGRSEHYSGMAARELHYGPHFQTVANIWRVSDPKQLLTKLDGAALDGAAGAFHGPHPALLDGCLQLLIATLRDEDEPTGGALYLPLKVAQFQLLAAPDANQVLWGYAVRRSEGTSLVGDLFLLDETERVVAVAYGVEMQRLDREVDVAEWLYGVRWQPAALEPNDRFTTPGSWLIFSDRQGVGEFLASQLATQGHEAHLVFAGEDFQRLRAGRYQIDPAQPEHFRALLRQVAPAQSGRMSAIVHLWGLDAEAGQADDPLALAQRQGPLAIMHLIQSVGALNLPDAPRLWLVTRGSQPVAQGVSEAGLLQSTLWGLGAVIVNEHPELRCRRIDLDSTITAQSMADLWTEIQAGTAEEQVALRAGQRFLARLVRAPELEMSEALPFAPTAQEGGAVVAQPGENYQLTLPVAGVLDNLVVCACPRPSPAPGQVEIEVRATGLNFVDVMKAMGVIPGLGQDTNVALGGECAGIVVAVGEGVEGFTVGDAVIAFNPAFHTETFFRAYVTVPAEVVVAKPAHLSFEEAATIPICFLTAYYAMIHLGRLQEGERVLIHSATGGVGLAAIQLAKLARAEIFATAGTPEKRAYLAQMGIEHRMDSRTLAFAGEVMERTGGQGVDMVLNSLAGEALVKSFAVLKSYGRFLEIGKRDIYQNSLLGMEPFKKCLSFFAIDLARVATERPAELGAMLRQLMHLFEDGTLQPLPVTTFPINEAAAAFRHMAQAKHTGKIVLAVTGAPVTLANGVQPARMIRQDATYLITGGLGGLGLTTARWLATQGARHLVLTGRSHPSPAAERAIRELEALGTEVMVAQADVSGAQAFAGLLARIDQDMPPLRGIIHAAGILDDALLMQLDPERFARVLAPKVQGAWNLHQLTQHCPLDFFVLYSSASVLLGFQGQANYVAANAYLDALAHYRRAQGLPALSINWGPWAQVGLAAAQANRGDRLAAQGVGSLTPAQGTAILERLLGQEVAQMGAMPLALERWFASMATAAQSPFFSELQPEKLAAAAAPHQESLRNRLLALPAGRQRRVLFEDYMREQVAQVLQLAPSRVRFNAPFKALGMDSLMTLELRNRLEAGLGLTLSATLIFNYPTIESLMHYLAQKMGVALESANDHGPAQNGAAQGHPLEDGREQDQPTQSIEDDLTQAEVEALLAEELATVDDLLKGV
ncbi:MAG: SDR family NAD(P)-dependent oxidoreductase [Caldilineaceae bacterium]|nr:SDR family NAD(P)-dependent oxidoreductase [Caldilineaceae bacterium]